MTVMIDAAFGLQMLPDRNPASPGEPGGKR